MKVIRAEQVYIKGNSNISKLCHLSKNLFNEANYTVKQNLKDNRKWVRYNELVMILRNSDNYKSLPATSQQILRVFDKSWVSFFKVIRLWKKNPEKFKRKPNPPRYKKKDGEHVLIFTNQQCRIKDYCVLFPKKMLGLDIKTRLPDSTNLREVRIVPKGVGYVCEVVYEKEIILEKKDEDRIVGIDFGIKNIVTMVNNIGIKPIVVKDDGKGIKSINQFYSKEKAKLQSIYDLQKIKNGVKMRRLSDKHKKKSKDYLHKLSKFIVKWCVKHNIGKIIFGYNEQWKQEINMGKQTNQIFTQIPYTDIIEKVTYKAEEVGIKVIKQEESHTSIVSFLDAEQIEHHDVYVGKRISRGLFKSAKGIVINSDVQGGYNIIRKCEPKAFVKAEADGVGGCELHPVQWKDDEIAQSIFSLNV